MRSRPSSGLPGMLKIYAAGGWNYDAFADAETHYRIESGTLGLVTKLVEDSGCELTAEHRSRARRTTIRSGAGCDRRRRYHQRRRRGADPAAQLLSRSHLCAGLITRQTALDRRRNDLQGRKSCMFISKKISDVRLLSVTRRGRSTGSRPTTTAMNSAPYCRSPWPARRP